jgi:hypothetical protein
MKQTRHILQSICPSFLRGDQAYSFLNEGIFTLYDVDTFQWWHSLLSRWPTFAPSDALPYLAADKLVIVGPNEPEAARRARIRGWLNEAILAGLPMGLAVALQSYAPGYPKISIATKRSTWYTLEAGAVPRMLGLAGYEPLPRCPYELGSQWPIGTSASAIERLRLSGLYTRHVPTIPNFDWDSISNPERSACWWDCVAMIHGGYTTPGSYDDFSRDYDNPLQSFGFDEPYGTFTTQWYLAEQRRSAKSVLRAIVWTDEPSDFNSLASFGDAGLCGWTGYDDGGVLRPTRPTRWRVVHEYPRT